ncbi:MAG TPA: hypothetical protein DDY22_05650 [Geobacter sp.]|nr:hypothetical protein [Geobacter sp.]
MSNCHSEKFKVDFLRGGSGRLGLGRLNVTHGKMLGGIRFYNCFITAQSSRVRRTDQVRLIPLPEPYVRAPYTAHVHSILALAR